MEPCGTPPPAVNIRYCKRLQPQDIARFTALGVFIVRAAERKTHSEEGEQQLQAFAVHPAGNKRRRVQGGGGRDDGGQEGNPWLPG